MATMRSRRTVHVLMGGPDAERDISIQSGTAVAGVLADDPRYDVREHVIEGTMLDDVLAALEADDIVLPMLHGPWGEGGALQAVLHANDIEFVGSAAEASRLAMDKCETKRRLEARGVCTPAAQLLGVDDTLTIEPPLVLKPNRDGSSVGVHICHSMSDVTAARSELHRAHDVMLAERYVRGREVTVGVLGGDTLPLIEIVPADASYDFEAKYTRDDTVYRIDPDDLPHRDLCLDVARSAFEHLGCRDLARIDFIVDERTAWFLELNTIPGFTSHSLVPMAARANGMTMTELIERLVAFAERRLESRAISNTRPMSSR